MSGNNNKNPTSSSSATTEFREIKAHLPYNPEWSIKLIWEPSRKKLYVEFNPSKQGRFYHDFEARTRVANQIRITVDTIIKNIVHLIGEIPNDKLPFFFNELEQSPIIYDLFKQLESISSAKKRQELLADGINQYVNAFLEKLTEFTYQQFDRRAHNALTVLPGHFKTTLIKKLIAVGFNINQATDAAETYCQDVEKFKSFKKVLLIKIHQLRGQFKEDIRLLADPEYNFSEIMSDLTSYADLFSLRACSSIQEAQSAGSTSTTASDQNFTPVLPEEEKADEKLPVDSAPTSLTEPTADIPAALPLIDSHTLTTVVKEDSKEFKSNIAVINFSEIFPCEISLYNGNLDLNLAQKFNPSLPKFILWKNQQKSSEKQCTIQAINFIKHAIFHIVNKKYSKADSSLKSALQCLSERANFLKDKPSDAFQVLGVVFCTYYLSQCAENDKRLLKGVIGYCNSALDILAKQITIAGGDRLKQLQQLEIQLEAGKKRLQEIIEAEKATKSAIVSSAPDIKSSSAPVEASSAELPTVTCANPMAIQSKLNRKQLRVKNREEKNAISVVQSEPLPLISTAPIKPEEVLAVGVQGTVASLSDTAGIDQLSTSIREQELYLLAVIAGDKPMKVRSIDQYANTSAFTQQLLSLKDLYKTNSIISRKLAALEQRIDKIAINRKIIVDINLSKEQLEHRIKKDAAALKHIQSQITTQHTDIASLHDYHMHNSHNHSRHDYHTRGLREHEAYLESIREIERYLHNPESIKPQEIKRVRSTQLTHTVLGPTPQPHYSVPTRTSLAQGPLIGHSLQALFAAAAEATVFKLPALRTPNPSLSYTKTNRQPQR